MKRIAIWLVSCFCAIVALAQTHDVRGEVLDRMNEPVVGASVRVKGFDLSTITDIDGKFLLREVPLEAEELIIESVGMETREVRLNEPILMTPGRKKLSFVVKAGVSMSRYTATGSDFKTGYEVGLGIEVRMSKKWAFQTGLDLCTRGAVYEATHGNSVYKETWNPLTLDLPMRFLVRSHLARNVNLVFSLGPMLSLGIGGQVKVTETGQSEAEYEIYSREFDQPWGEDRQYSLLSPFSFGAVYGMGVEYKKLLIGVTGKSVGLMSDGMELIDHNLAWTFGVSYRF